MYLKELLFFVVVSCLTKTVYSQGEIGFNTLEKGKTAIFYVGLVNKKEQISKDNNKYRTIINKSGTGFFISDHIFISAYHVFNSLLNKENHIVLFNEYQSYKNPKIIYENKYSDIIICRVEKKSSGKLKIGRYDSTKKNVKLMASIHLGQFADLSFESKNGFIANILIDTVINIFKFGEIMNLIYLDSIDSIKSVGGFTLKNCEILEIKPRMFQGFSGGPVLDELNNVIGITSMTSKLTAQSTVESESGLTYAIYFYPLLIKLIKAGKLRLN